MKSFLFPLLTITLLLFKLISSCSSESDNQIPEDTSNLTKQTDTDGDGVADSEDAWPIDSSMSENLWGVINNENVEFFFASDVSENISKGTRDSFLEAIDEFGNWGPTELWVSGPGKEGSVELANLYCNRRVERGQAKFQSDSYPWTLESCQQLSLYPTLGDDLIPPRFGEGHILSEEEGNLFEYYRGKSVLTIENNWPTGWGKGLNGAREWGFKIYNFSLPVGFSEPGYNFDYEKVNVFYEYFHALQESAFPDDALGDTHEFGEDTRRGPHWFYSGASTYYAEYAVRKRDENHNLNSLKERIEQQFGYAICDDILLSDLTPESECFLMKFYWGMPAIAYLLDRANNQNAIIETFYPNLYKYGFKAAFELTFGITVEKFYNEWEIYRNLPMEQRLEIVPDI